MVRSLNVFTASLHLIFGRVTDFPFRLRYYTSLGWYSENRATRSGTRQNESDTEAETETETETEQTVEEAHERFENTGQFITLEMRIGDVLYIVGS